MRMTMIGLGNLMEVIWPIISRTVGGDDVADRVIGVTADADDAERKRAVFGFDVVIDDNLGALRRNRPDIILFAPPPTVAPGLIEAVLRPYFDERRTEGGPLPDLYAFPPLPAGSTYLEALGDDVLVANIIPNNVTSIGGRPVVDEGHYVCTYPAPWPPERIAVLQGLFDGQGAYVHLEPDQLLEFLGGACAISCLWKIVPLVADLLAETGAPVPHGEIGEYLRGQLRALTAFVPSDSTPVRPDFVPAHAEFLAAIATAWHRGVTDYFAGTTLAADAAGVLIERGFDLTLHTCQAESREVLDELAVGAATKGGLLERAIRSVHEDLMPVLRAGVDGPPDDGWVERLASAVGRTAEIVRLHGATLAG